MNLRKLNPKYIYIAVAVVLAGLIGVQLYWISHSVQLQKAELEKRLKEDMADVSKQVEEDAYCFSLSARSYFKKGEGIYIVKQSRKGGKFTGPANGGYLDTLDMFNIFYMKKDTFFVREKSIDFEQYPTIVDVSLKFTAIGASPRIQRKDTSAYLATLNDTNFKQVLANKFKVDEMIDTALLDSLAGEVLAKNRLNVAFELGIRKEGSKKYEYLKKGSDPKLLNSSTLFTPFLVTNRFNKPYQLVMYVPDTFAAVLRSLSVMMISSLLIIFILVASYVYFIKTILKQRKLSEMKTTFINNITHEFRTPITNINLAIENWRDASHKNGYYVDIIEEENKHMEKNVQRILQLATMEHAEERNNLSHVDIHELIKATICSFGIQLERVNGKVVFNFHATQPCIYAEREQMVNLFYNLTDNAIKYSSGEPEITIYTYNANQQLIIQFEDTGIGMSQEMQKHIFTRFYRGHTGDRHDVKGFGLGLSYVKHIVESHEGEIYVKSKPGMGTKFTIYLPENILV
jgi:two-component system phosphate regulon sensor histidine kinase PhoR